ncbi:hypothetical protein jhhlp_005421 [Lomentospora prolificans]|uniref:Uncharacterized protein n=1 Tax=Lomentospora prolificans TaxID=41688 RepID=A0A2N3N6T2_9PEZI|nr:hypothetical protein jhhlp_005421 [Lomentospora prolificans]
MTLNGTMEDLITQVLQINPDYLWPGEDPANTGSTEKERGDRWRDRVVAAKDCSVPDGRAFFGAINAAIYMCWEPIEDAPEVYNKPCWYIADYAQGIAEKWCPRVYDKKAALSLFGGNFWDSLGLAVYVRRDRC